MGSMNVCFLGKEYSISDQLPQFVKLLWEFEGYRNQLYDVVIKQIENGEYVGGAEEDFERWRSPIENIAKKLIKNAADVGVYDLTIAELVDDNPGYSELNRICTETLKKIVSGTVEAMGNYLDSVESAEREAASQITGAGFSIWTSSLSSALIYSAIEANALSKQSKQAEKDFQQAVSSLNSKMNDNLEKQEKSILTNFYYPGCKDSISNIVSYMLDVYIKKISSIGFFDYDEVNQYSLSNSCEIMKNLEIVSQKEEVLHKAFEKCPYNLEIYRRLIDMNNLDFNTFFSTKVLGLSAVLLEDIKTYCINGVKNSREISDGVRIWADFSTLNETVIYSNLYGEKINMLVQKYNYLVNCINNKKIIDWIKENTTLKSDEQILGCHELERIIGIAINNLVDVSEIEKYLTLGIFNIGKLGLQDSVSTELQDINSELYAKVLQVLPICLEELKLECIRRKEQEEKLRIEQEKREEQRIKDQKEKKREKANFFVLVCAITVIVPIQILIGFFIFLLVMGVDVVNKQDKLVEEVIKEQISISKTIGEYEKLSEDERDSLCLKKHIKIKGRVSEVSRTYITLKENEFSVRCYIDDVEAQGIVEDAIVTLDGVCTISSIDSMMLDSCTVTNIDANSRK